MNSKLQLVFAIILLSILSVIIGIPVGKALTVLHMHYFEVETARAYNYELLCTLFVFVGCVKIIYDGYE